MLGGCQMDFSLVVHSFLGKCLKYEKNLTLSFVEAEQSDEQLHQEISQVS